MKKRIYLEVEEDLDIYNEEARESLIEDDEISSAEEAFMEGYENA